MSPSVKVFGCRPITGVAAGTRAGVRKPAREETAGERAPIVPRTASYEDLSAASDLRPS
jgi:hypothetical protein